MQLVWTQLQARSASMRVLPKRTIISECSFESGILRRIEEYDDLMSLLSN